MEHAEQVRLLKVLMAHLDNDTNVDAGGMRRNPSQAYTDPVRCQNSAEQLSGPAIVVVEHPAQPFAALDSAA